jgi:hypothetical protein
MTRRRLQLRQLKPAFALGRLVLIFSVRIFRADIRIGRLIWHLLQIILQGSQGHGTSFN